MMMRSIPTTGIALLLPFAAFSQSATLPVFEVASIRPNVNGLSAPIETGPKTFTARGMSVSVLIQWAYRLRDFQVIGPEWIKSERYDVQAKSQESTPESELRLMLQALLAERFHLQFHRGTRAFSGYALSVARNGPKLELAIDTTQGNIQIGRGGILYGRAAPMLTLAGALTVLIGEPVVDRTGLDGKYDFKLEYDPGSVNGRESGTEPPPGSLNAKASIYTALQEQLGLRLASNKEPLEVLVIDSLERPSDN